MNKDYNYSMWTTMGVLYWLWVMNFGTYIRQEGFIVSWVYKLYDYWRVQ